MSRLTTPANIDAAPASARPLLDAVNQQIGSVPNLFRLVANSPAALEGYLGMSGRAGQGQPAGTRRASASRWRWPRSTTAATACRPTATWARTSRS